MKPMLTLALSLTGYTLSVTFTTSLVGATTITTIAFPASTTKRNNLSASASDGVLKAVLDALNAAEAAAGTNGTWTAPTITAEPCGVRFKRTPPDPADRISTVGVSSGLATLLGLSTSNTPTHNGSGEYTLQTGALGGVWVCNRHALSDLKTPYYPSVNYARSPAGYGELLVGGALFRRLVVLESVPGCYVLSDAFTRGETWRQVSGMTANDTNAPLEVLWRMMLGGGTDTPNMTLRYHPDRSDLAAYQDVDIEDPRVLADPVGSGAWEQTTPTPNLWRLRLPLIDRTT